MDSPQTKETLKNIRKLIAEDKLDKAFKELTILGENLNITSLNNDGAILSGKFSGVEKDLNSGILKYEDFQIEKTRISKALTDLLSQIEDGTIITPTIEPIPASTPVIPPTPPVNQSISKTLDYVFMGLVVTLFLTCIGGLIYTLLFLSEQIFPGTMSMSGLFGCLYFMNSWRSKLGVSNVLQTIPA